VCLVLDACVCHPLLIFLQVWNFQSSYWLNPAARRHAEDVHKPKQSVIDSALGKSFTASNAALFSDSADSLDTPCPFDFFLSHSQVSTSCILHIAICDAQLHLFCDGNPGNWPGSGASSILGIEKE
jgi:hypothetical protein